jgi:di/tricarboxylate transporter
MPGLGACESASNDPSGTIGRGTGVESVLGRFHEKEATVTPQAWLTLAILVAMFATLLLTKLPPWAVFMGALTLMMAFNLAPATDLLSGFANTSVATVGALFVVAAGMYSTGAISLLADKIIGLPGSIRQASTRILPPVAAGSAFLNNTPLVAMMIPVVQDLSRIAGLAVTYLLMPLSLASILGGAMTLIGTSTNLIIAGMINDSLASGTLTGMSSPGLFFPTPIALPAGLLGIGFMIVAGRRFLPAPKQAVARDETRRSYLAEFVVAGGTPLAGKVLRESGLIEAKGYRLMELRPSGDKAPTPEAPRRRGRLLGSLRGLFRRGRRKGLESPAAEGDAHEGFEPAQVLNPGDRLVFECGLDGIPTLWSTIGLRPAVAVGQPSSRYLNRLAEVVVGDHHPVVGRQIQDIASLPEAAEFVAVLAGSRDDQKMDGRLRKIVVQAGDRFVVEVPENFFFENRDSTEYVSIRRIHGYQVQRLSRAAIAGAITLVMVLLAAFGVMPMLEAALLAGAAMLLTGCLTLRSAWRSIDFQTLIVLGAAIGFQAPITQSGLADVISNLMLSVTGGSAMLALAVTFVAAILMTNLITNSAAASFLYPITLSIAASLGVSFAPFAAILMVGVSYSFINPAGYQTNLMVQKPGGYSFGDYARLGVPLTLLAGGAALLLTPLVYGF